MLSPETRVGFKENIPAQLGPFLGTCGYHFLPQKEKIRVKDIKRGERDDQIKFVKNLSSESHWPRFEIAITPSEDGKQPMRVNLHFDRGPYRAKKRSEYLIFDEGRRILAILSSFKPTSPEKTVFQKALTHFLMFGNAESVGKQRELEGVTYYKWLLNRRRRQHRKTEWTGWQKRKKLESFPDFREEDF